jgi:hypothetical protein
MNVAKFFDTEDFANQAKLIIRLEAALSAVSERAEQLKRDLVDKQQLIAEQSAELAELKAKPRKRTR